MASIYLRGRVWWIKFSDNGQRVQQSLKTRDKAVAKYRKNEIEIRLAQGSSPLPSLGRTAQECFEEFKKDRINRVSPRAQAADHFRIQNFIDEMKIGSLRTIREDVLKAHLDQRIKDDKISNQTADHTIRAIKTFLNFCVRRRYLGENPLSGMKLYPVEKKAPRFLSSDELRAFLAAAIQTPYYPIFMTAIYTGMRLGEIERIEWEDINFKENIITVHQSKAKRFRDIPLHPDLRVVIEPMKGTGRCFNFTSDELEWKFPKIREASKVRKFRFHDLRHTFASLMIKCGADLLTVSKLLGHSNTKTTEIYAHLYSDHVHDAVNRLHF